MVEAKCMSKNRNSKGCIVNYTLQDRKGNVFSLSEHTIKELICNKLMDVCNLKIDKDGRLIDKFELEYRKKAVDAIIKQARQSEVILYDPVNDDSFNYDYDSIFNYRGDIDYGRSVCDEFNAIEVKENSKLPREVYAYYNYTKCSISEIKELLLDAAKESDIACIRVVSKGKPNIYNFELMLSSRYERIEEHIFSATGYIGDMFAELRRDFGIFEDITVEGNDLGREYCDRYIESLRKYNGRIFKLTRK